VAGGDARRNRVQPHPQSGDEYLGALLGTEPLPDSLDRVEDVAQSVGVQ
jgi:hypothetical protein